jgi:hypothetical protein
MTVRGGVGNGVTITVEDESEEGGIDRKQVIVMV